jgi:hypothetical protein
VLSSGADPCGSSGIEFDSIDVLRDAIDAAFVRTGAPIPAGARDASADIHGANDAGSAHAPGGCEYGRPSVRFARLVVLLAMMLEKKKFRAW